MTRCSSRVAVLAHFDPEGKLPSHTRLLITELLTLAAQVVVVSTRLDTSETRCWGDRVRFIIRPNYGYDFYSYKVGLESIPDLCCYDELIIANDSVFMVRPGGLRQAMLEMAGVKCDAWSLTSSHQISFHLQSYFLVIRKSVFVTEYFRTFWQGVRVIDSKWEIILAYEIGFSQMLLANGASLRSAFEPTADDIRLMWRRLIPSLRRRFGWLNPINRRLAREANQVHYLWDRIFTRYGVIKNEVLRDDPNKVVANGLRATINKDAAQKIAQEMTRVRKARPLAAPIEEASTSDLNDNSLRQFTIQAIDSQSPKRNVALVLHLYHVDLLEEIFAYAKNIICPVDFFVSVKNVEDYFVVKAFFQKHGVVAFIYVHENRGRDVGPFISLLNSGLLDRYMCVCKIHSKKSAYHVDGSRWRDELYGGLLGSKYDVLRIISAFEQYPDCGMVGADNAFVTNARFWGGNEARLRALAAELGIGAGKVRLGFFAGTMFWFRPAALVDLKQRQLRLDDFEPEEGQRDATLAHVLERLFPLIIEHRNYFVATSVCPNVPLEYTIYEDRGVLVL